MTIKTTKLIKTVYLYLVAAVSLIFIAIGTSTFISTGLKATFFPEAEKKSYYECNNEPSIIIPESGEIRNLSSEDQKKQIDSMLEEYEKWKENQSGDKCIIPVRQNKLIDAFTMILIALPICLFHWRLIKKEKDEKED
jgi:hypothetical protein